MIDPEDDSEFDGNSDLDFFKAVEYHLDDHQFRRKVMLFKRCDNVLRPLLDNLEQIDPITDEEITIYKAFLSATRIVLDEMRPFFPDGTYSTLVGRLAVFESRIKHNGQ